MARDGYTNLLNADLVLKQRRQVRVVAHVAAEREPDLRVGEDVRAERAFEKDGRARAEVGRE